jgi:signal transduction histidine kinase/ligand-binding sensor domain-containing protein
MTAEAGKKTIRFLRVNHRGLVRGGIAASLAWSSVGLGLFLQASPARAISPDLALSQLGHSAWRVQDGVLPGIPNVITQTADGYVWIGTQAGLVRFDGRDFVPIAPPLAETPVSTQVTALYGARDGSLWMGTASQLLQLKEGRFHLYRTLHGQIEAVREARDGTIWVARDRTNDVQGPLCAVRAQRLACYGPKQGIPLENAGPLALEKSGAIWLGSSNELVRWQNGRSTTYAPAALVRTAGLGGFGAIAIAPDGTIFSGVMARGPGLGLEYSADGSWSPVIRGHIDSSTWEVTALLFDRDGTLWVGTFNDGIYRIAGSRIDHFGTALGLTSDSVADLLEDREGDIWVATDGGIDKFHAIPVVTVSSRQGLSSDNADAVLVSRSGAIWVSNGTALDKLEHGHVTSYNRRNGLPGRLTTALFEDSRGQLWIGVDDGVAVLDHGRFTRVHAADPRIGPIQEFAAGPGATVWGISVGRPSRLVLMNTRRVLQVIPAPEGTELYPLTSAPDGSLWTGLYDGKTRRSDLGRYQNGKWQIFALRNPPLSGVLADILVPDSHTVFTAADGISEWRDGVVRKLSVTNGLPCARVHAMLFGRDGNLWLYLPCGVAWISSRQLAGWWKDPAAKLQIPLLDVSNGALPSPADFYPNAAIASDGKVWFANSSVLQFVDPRHWVRNLVVPPVHIQALYADDRAYDLHLATALPPRTRNLQIDFTALSFVDPRRVQFRIRLDGWDHQWQNPGLRREAFYNNLPPGSYTFRVLAGNNDGVWNLAGASLSFSILPTYYQTLWFRMACVAAGILIVWVLYFLRVRQQTAAVRSRLGERMIERERIARELHDTLLQGFQGLLLRFHAILKQLERPETARSLLESALVRADQVLTEGRLKVRDLLPDEDSPGDLSQALEEFGRQYAGGVSVDYRVVTVGTPRELQPLSSRELIRAGREAVTNAFLHAGARRIIVEVHYSTSAATLIVEDDGQGIPAELKQNGRPGHFGLRSMRAAAAAIGGTLSIRDRDPSGTIVTLTVPAHLAYDKPSGSALWRFLRRT